MTEEQLFAESLLAGAHSIEALRAEFGAHPAADGEINLASEDPARFEDLRGNKVAPIPGVRRYLESGDALTDHTVDQMELAMEKAYQIVPPFFITTLREGMEGKDLRVLYFYLDRE